MLDRHVFSFEQRLLLGAEGQTAICPNHTMPRHPLAGPGKHLADHARRGGANVTVGPDEPLRDSPDHVENALFATVGQTSDTEQSVEHDHHSGSGEQAANRQAGPGTKSLGDQLDQRERKHCSGRKTE